MTSRIRTIVEAKAFHHFFGGDRTGGLAAEWRDEFRPAVTRRNLEELVA